MKKRVLPILIATIIIMIAIAGLLSLFDELSGPFGSTGLGQGEGEGQSSGTPGGMQSNDGTSPQHTSTQDTEQATENGVSATCSRCISPQGGLPQPVPLFRVEGAAQTALLRSVAASDYDGKLWNISQVADRLEYEGGELIVSVSGFSRAERDRITVTPLTQFSSGFIPTSLYPTQVSLQSPLSYYPDELSFFSESAFSITYAFSTTHYLFDESTLNRARVTGDKMYLQLPDAITQRTKRLASEITLDLETPYERIKAIESYLQRNYENDPLYQSAPQGWEPNDWFLFEEKKGVCANFNSAFAILCRSEGIPARLATGFAIQPIADEQVVRANQSHTWVEIAFEDLGWIAFDATGPANKIPTVTLINSVSSIAEKGYTFEVEGEVLTEDGYGVDKMPLEILINETNARGGTLVGNGETAQGHFKIACTAPTEITVGDYYIIAHSLGTDRYAESWSVLESKLRLPSTTQTTDGQMGLPTTIEINSASTIAKKGYGFSISGQLMTSMGEKADNVAVEIFLNKTKDKGGTLIGTGNTAQGNFLVSCKVPEEMSVGEYQIIAHALADNRYYESWSDPDIKVITATKIALYLPQTTSPNQTITISGSLTEEFGAAVANEEVLISIEGKGTIANPITNGKGEFSAKYAFDEIGTYNVTAEFKGTQYYLASSASVEIKILRPTSLNLDLPEKALVGDPVSFKGNLKDTNGSTLASQTISIYINRARLATIITAQDGTFSTIYRFEKAGTYDVEAKFDTSPYYLESSSNAQIEILTVPLDIQTNDTFIRNEDVVIHGIIGTPANIYPKESVVLFLDGVQLAQSVADANGRFQFTYHVPATAKLGPHILEYRVPGLGITETQGIAFKARTFLTLSAPDTAKPGDYVNVKATLKDDLGTPIDGAEIISQTDGLSATTDRNGTANLSLHIPDNSKESSQSSEYRSLGTDLQLPSSSKVQISLRKHVFPWWTLAFVPVVGFGSYGGYLLYKRRKDKPVPPLAAVKEVVEPDIVQLGDKDINININFPQIEKDLPDVWGLNDGLNIELLLTDRQGNGLAKRDIEVYIEKALLGKFLADDSGEAKLVQTFSNKGEHSILGKFDSDHERESIQGTRKIRIVDYREEIVVLFNTFLAWSQSDVTSLRKDATPREIERILIHEHKEIDQDALGTVISCFEEADYSTHEIFREHYITMFLAQKRVKDSLGGCNGKGV